MIELAALAVIAVTIFAIVAAGLVLLKFAFWVVLFPLRLLFGFFVLPLVLLKAVAGTLLFVVIGPVLAIAALACVVAVAAAVLIPLLPVLFIAFVIWFVLRASNRSTAIAR